MTVDFNGTLLKLTQEPYIDMVDIRIGDTVEKITGTVYRAHAVDSDGNDYEAYWTQIADGEVTDWDAYRVIRQ